MNKFAELIRSRRSTRKFTEELLSPEQVETILKAGLMSPTSKNSCPWHFVVVEDKFLLEKMSVSKKSGSKLIAGCALAIVVLSDPQISEAWVEDASIASIMIQLQAEDLGLGSCWVQIKDRYTADENSSEEYIKDLLNIPLHLQVLSIVAIGHKAQELSPFSDENLQWEKVHIGKY